MSKFHDSVSALFGDDTPPKRRLEDLGYTLFVYIAAPALFVLMVSAFLIGCAS